MPKNISVNEGGLKENTECLVINFTENFWLSSNLYTYLNIFYNQFASISRRGAGLHIAFSLSMVISVRWQNGFREYVMLKSHFQ